MSDWQGLSTPQRTLFTIDIYSGGAAGDMAAMDFTANGSAVWPAANRAIYVPVVVTEAVTAYQMAINVAIQSGNLDIGIYDELGNRLVHSGSTAVGTAGIQVIDITNTDLTPGCYFLALCVDNTTASVGRITSATALQMQISGIQQQAVGAVTLPDPATFANPTSAYFPVVFASLMQATI